MGNTVLKSSANYRVSKISCGVGLALPEAEHTHLRDGLGIVI